MRINLKCKYAEKDWVKALGARWDPARKTWYIENVDDLTPFKKWIVTRPEKEKPKLLHKHYKTTGQATYRNLCDCDVLPWDDCMHTQKNRPQAA